MIILQVPARGDPGCGSRTAQVHTWYVYLGIRDRGLGVLVLLVVGLILLRIVTPLNPSFSFFHLLRQEVLDPLFWLRGALVT